MEGLSREFRSDETESSPADRIFENNALIIMILESGPVHVVKYAPRKVWAPQGTHFHVNSVPHCAEYWAPVVVATVLAPTNGRSSLYSRYSSSV